MTNLERYDLPLTYGGGGQPRDRRDPCSRSARGCVAARRPPTRASSSLEGGREGDSFTATAELRRSCAPPTA